MTFQNISFLYWLVSLIPLGILLWYRLHRNKKMAQLIGVTSNELPRTSLEVSKACLLLGCITCFIVALANPLGGLKEIKVERKATDVMIAIDVSRSMYADDIKPTRMDRAKIFSKELITKIPTERIGLIAFAGEAYVSMPLSSDHRAAILLVQTISPESVTNQGTSIGKAIEEFLSTIEDEKDKERVMIIISDGENHDQKAIESAINAHDNGVTIFTIGVGTQRGSKIKVIENGREFILKNNAGEEVISKYSPDLLQKIAQAGGGVYYEILAGTKIITDLKDRLKGISKTSLEEETISDRNSLFHIPLGLGILSLLGFLLLNYHGLKRNK